MVRRGRRSLHNAHNAQPLRRRKDVQPMEGPHHPGQRYRDDDRRRPRLRDRPHRHRCGAPWSPPCRDGAARRGRLHRRCLCHRREHPQPKTTAVTPGVYPSETQARFATLAGSVRDTGTSDTRRYQEPSHPLVWTVAAMPARKPSGTTPRPTPSPRRPTLPPLQLVQPRCGQPDAPAGPPRVPGHPQDLLHRQPALPGHPPDPRRRGLQPHSRAM